jgi:hypothetical protein
MTSSMAETSHRRINAMVAVICVVLVVVKVSGKSMGAQAARTSDAVISCDSGMFLSCFELQTAACVVQFFVNGRHRLHYCCCVVM